jgi:regulator of replication initiation timing
MPLNIFACKTPFLFASCSAQDIISSQHSEIEELRTTFTEVVMANGALKQELEALKEKV